MGKATPPHTPTYDKRIVQDIYDRINRISVGTGVPSGANDIAPAGGGSYTVTTINKTETDYMKLLTRDNYWLGENVFQQSVLFQDGMTMYDTAIFSSETFASGSSGSGFRLKRNDLNKWMFEIDALRVRGSMMIAELLFQSVRTFNGSILIGRTGTAKVTSVEKVGRKSYGKFLDK
jgi:hypothetical protein